MKEREEELQEASEKVEEIKAELDDPCLNKCDKGKVFFSFLFK